MSKEKQIVTTTNEKQIYGQIREILISARAKAYASVNFAIC